MEKMDRGHLLLLLIALLQGIQGQVIGPSSSDVAAGVDVLLACTTDTTQSTFTFTWNHVNTGDTIYSAGVKIQPRGSYDNFDLVEDVPGKRSTLNISSILLQDAGQYRCAVSQQGSIDATVNVQVGSPEIPIVLESINGDTQYRATCDAIGSSPVESITWILGGVTQTDGIVETDPGSSADPLFDLRSVFTFLPTVENYDATLECQIGGHDLVPTLNRRVSRQVNVHNRPESTGVKVDFNSNSGSTQLTITCTINDAVPAAIPAMDTFYIYSNGTRIHMSTTSVNSVTVTEPEQETEYACIGGNYLGNTTEATNTYDPSSTTTPSPTTEPITTEGSTTGPPGTPGLGIGAIIGIVIGALLVIIVIVVLLIVFVLKPDCVSGFRSSSRASSGPKKHGSSSVGSSNGNEKSDVETPLNGVNEDKMKPTPTPRVQSPITHTHENPGNAEYAMVDRKPKPGSGGDMPDTRGNGAGQNDHPGMHYADLDLTANAGHTEREVPQNPENVVVYSSILV